jgi:hypothetical protein
MSPIIDFVKRQLQGTNTSNNKGPEVPNAESNPHIEQRQNSDIICRSGYLNEG